MESTILGLSFIAISLLIYFLPSFIAFMREHHNAWAILLTNLLLGWIVLGWIIALIWSVTAVRVQTNEK